jgi:hypothetical protein
MRYFLEVVLTPELPLIRRFSLCPLKDDLTDSNTGFEDEGKWRQVSDLKHLAIVDPGLNKACGHMNDQAHSSKTAPSFKPTTNITG